MQAIAQRATKYPTLDELNAEMARRHHLDFMQYVWQKSAEPFIVGRHTRKICEMIDEAFVKFERGESTFLVIEVPFRHGKSDVISRNGPPHFLGRFPDQEVMLATYGDELANDLSRFARRIMGSPQYAKLYSKVKIAKDSSAADRWGIESHTGGMYAVGFGGAMTGRGYGFGIVDDYLKNRAQAESSTIRDKVWESFTQDFMTRRAPTSVTIILATPWHVDDLIGRIRREMASNPSFPRFEFVKFPAFSEEYPEGVLFPERFSHAWYESQKAVLGDYGFRALMQLDPRQKFGLLLKTDKIVVHDSISEFPQDLRAARFWDLASTVKDRLSPNPHWTAGVKGGLQMVAKADADGVRVPHLWVIDVKRCREEAPERDRLICKTARDDGPTIAVGVESVAGYKDTYAHVRETLRGLSIVSPVVPAGDKLVRASPLEPIFEAGNVHLLRGDWNDAFIGELADFPNGEYDDQVDALSGLYAMLALVPQWGVVR